MRIVIALGGNALLRRSDPQTTEVQRRNVKVAAEAIAPLAGEHSIGRVTLEELAGYDFAAGSMGPKAEAAVRFATKTGRRAATGSLTDIAAIVAGEKGTNVAARTAPGPQRGSHGA